MVVYIIYIQKPMIENSNFYSGSKRVAGGGIAIALVKTNGLMRAAGKHLQVMVAGTGPLSNRMDMYVSEERAFANSGGTAEIFVFVLFDRGQRLFYFPEVKIMKRWRSLK